MRRPVKPRRDNHEHTVMMKTRVVIKDVEVLEKTSVVTASRDAMRSMDPRTTVFAVPAAIEPKAPRLARGSSPALPVLTPAVEREVFQLARRVAMQADLGGALRVLKAGVAQMTAS